MRFFYFFILVLIANIHLSAQDSMRAFDYLDVFDLEWASDPQISPNGKEIVYLRNGFDIMTDKKVGSLWIIDEKGGNHRKLTSSDRPESQAKWSPDGKRIAFVSSTEKGAEIFIYWIKNNTYARISQLEKSPSSLTWSSNGKQLAFSSFVPGPSPKISTMPAKPESAVWAKAPRITTRLKHEADGQGYLPDGFYQLFVIDTQGGKAKQVTHDKYHHRGGISWGKKSNKLYFSANRSSNWEYEFGDSNIFSVDIKSKEIIQLSANNGPEYNPIVSPDGRKIAYLGYEDKIRTYQLTELFVMNIDGSGKERWLIELDRSIKNIQWGRDSETIYYSYDDKGNTKIGKVKNIGRGTVIAENMGGTTIGRPYASGSFSISARGHMVYTSSTPYHPSELIYQKKNKEGEFITTLNHDVFEDIELGKVEEVWYKSSVDGRDIQGWIIKPPFYDSNKQYPLLVENHGGPILNYGDRFTAELQLYASKGYLVFYPNPRGSTSYGEKFGDLLFNNYPGDDYQDVMDGVDHLISKGLAYEDQLFVTGGSAGGIMTAWMIGKNKRFEAAVVHKPVMNWISKTLVADNYYGYANYRYPGQPWENFETYWKFSPISLVGNIETPTMVMVGMIDLRTPPSEAKQLYHALKLRRIETVLVEIPGASHGIAKRPSNLITKVAHTIDWCNRFKK